MPQQDDYNSRSRSLMVVGADDGWTLAPGEPGMPSPGDLVSGKYRIEHIVGRGGMGAVYRATHVLMDKPVAVKWMTPELGGHEEARERFTREARAAARIRHPNVVDVYDVGSQGSALYMVMELLEGESFETLVLRDDIPVTQLLELLIQAMRGVAEAHAQGIVHRDIKPDNIFIVADSTQRGGLTAKVLDFGISKLHEEQPGSAGLTKSGMTMGTPAYMSLEQMNGARDVDARADTYAFGVLLYRALTGVLPFDGETFGAVAVAIATHNPPSPRQLRPELPLALDQIVMQAMARNRDQRFATLQDLIDALQSLDTQDNPVGQRTHAAAPAPTFTPVSRERPRVEIERSVLFDPEFDRPAPASHSGLWIVLALSLAGVGFGAWRWASQQVAARDPDELQAPVSDPAPTAPALVPPATTQSTKAQFSAAPSTPAEPATPPPSIAPETPPPAEVTGDTAAPPEPQTEENVAEDVGTPAGEAEPVDRSSLGAAPDLAEPSTLTPLPPKRAKRPRTPEPSRKKRATDAKPAPAAGHETEGPLPDKRPAPNSGGAEDEAADSAEDEPAEPNADEADEHEAQDESDSEASSHRSGGVRLEDL